MIGGWFYFNLFFVFDGGGWQRLAVGVVVWVCKERGGFSEKSKDTDMKREKEERKKHI